MNKKYFNEKPHTAGVYRGEFRKDTQFTLVKKLYESEIFAQVELTPSAKLFLWALCSHYNPNHKTMFPSQATVSKRLGMSERSAERAVKELREKGLVTYITKRVNHYEFSEKFFGLVKMSDEVGQNVGYGVGQNVGLTNNNEQKNKEGFLKNSFKGRNGTTMRVYDGVQKYFQPGGKAVPSIEETRKYIEEREKIRAENFNPLDYTKDEAMHWLKTADIAYLMRSKIAMQLIEKYDLKGFEHILKYKS